MADEPEPFYQPLSTRGETGGERFHATFSTTGPWFADAQHGGPPAALLVRALERCGPRPDAQLGRVTFELLGPVPAGEVTVRAGVERPGRAIELLGAELVAGGRTVMRARGWRLAVGDTSEVVTGQAPPLPGPELAEPRATAGRGWLPGFLDAMEWRWLAGDWEQAGPGTAWLRQRVPLVEGEEPTPWQRLAVAADCSNGVAAPLDLRSWLFVNTELTLHVHRPPLGEWIAVDAATTVGPTGIGTVAARLFDTDGHVGRATQELVVRPR